MFSLLLIALMSPIQSAAAPLAISSFTLEKTESVGLLPASVVLNNRGTHPLRLWAPNNVEGMNALRFVFRSAQGKVVEYRPPVPPRAAGVATAVVLEPRSKLRLPTSELSGCRKLPDLPPGVYEVTAVYKNELADFAPVKGVWTGTIRSKPLQIRL